MCIDGDSIHCVLMGTVYINVLMADGVAMTTFLGIDGDSIHQCA
jgi:hypothetical protein